MRDIRVAHVVPAPFSPTGIIGGAERYAHELARHMAKEVPTSLVTFGPADLREQHDGLDLRVIGGAWAVRGQATNPFSLRLFSALRDATVVHCHQQHVVASTAVAAFARLTRRKAFVTNLGGGGWDLSAYWSTDNWYHGHLHISRYSLDIFGQHNYPRAHVIMGGVDTGRFSPGEPATPPAKPTVLFVGRLLPHKGVNYLIQALPEGMHLDIIGRPGDDRYHADLLALAAGRQVTFHHDFDDAALVAAYRRATCVVLPSVYRTMYGSETRIPELLGQTLLEGMACGIPAICTSVASMPEVVEHEKTGFVVPPNDPAALRERLGWLRDHPDEARAMGRAGRKLVVERFTWPRVVQRCLEIYRS